MSTHIYAFGSICRGEFDPLSDVDLLACVSEKDSSFDPEKFSIYTHERMKEMWRDGNPFAWHLHLESKLIYSSTGRDFIKELGSPAGYTNGKNDCAQFFELLKCAKQNLSQSSNSPVFEISCIFLAARNFATCLSLSYGKPVFSRRSPLLINNPLDLSDSDFNLLVRARVLSTRGLGKNLTAEEINRVDTFVAPKIYNWMTLLADRVPS